MIVSYKILIDRQMDRVTANIFTLRADWTAISMSHGTLSRKQDHVDRLIRKLFMMHKSLSRKQEITDSLGIEAKYDGRQSWQEAKSGRLVYTLC